MSLIIKTHRLTKRWNGQETVSQMNMNVKKGEIYGFLGPNGAGKTTVLKMLTSLVQPSDGEIEIFGMPMHSKSYDILKRMGSMIEYPVFYEKLTGLENLELHCEYMGFYNKTAIADVLEQVKLTGIDKKPVKEYSLGMKQRLGIARAIVTRPELLLLDEPINGLDPVGIREMRSLFHLLSKQYGMTILISSHILGEIEQIADTIGVINHGKLLQEVPMEEVRSMNTNYIEISVLNRSKAVYVLEQLGISNMKISGEKEIRIYDLSLPEHELLKVLTGSNVEIESMQRKSKSLEDYFLQVIHGGDLSA